MKFKFIKEVKKVKVIEIDENKVKELKKIIYIISFFYFVALYQIKFFKTRGHLEFFGEKYKYDITPLHNPIIGVTHPLKKFRFGAWKVKEDGEVIVRYSKIIEETSNGAQERKEVTFSLMLTKYLYEKTANKEI